MKSLKSFFLIALVVLCCCAASFAQSRIGGRVVEIVDGKTVVIETIESGRLVAELQYIEVPEAGQPLCETAREHLRALVEGKAVEFRAKGLAQTKIVGQLISGGVDISQQRIRDGAAWYAVAEKSGQDAAESDVYRSNEAQARAEKRGVWSIENLKPSWEMSAERERERENLAREAERKAAEQTTVSSGNNSSVGKNRNAARAPLSNDNFQMWADVSG